MTPYENMQEELANATREQSRQRKKAAAIMNKLAARCVAELEIPAENIKFTPTQDGPRLAEQRGYSDAARVIERNDEGVWTAEMEIKVDPPADDVHIYTTTIVRVQVIHSPLDHVQLGLKGEVAAELDGTPADTASFSGIVGQVPSRISDTTRWVATGKGKKPAMGFDSIRQK
ncbi:MAG TPA: hypothetical protein VNP98_05830 [Chthoniobacterales bacterium]|nr:hypothetical protein [Chthoniobacterales bacterium]